MPYITSFERIAVEEGEARGEARGRAEGMKDGIALALKLKFGEARMHLAPEIRQLADIDTLKRVADSIETAGTIDDVRRVWSGS